MSVCDAVVEPGRSCRLGRGQSGIARGPVDRRCAHVGCAELVDEPPPRIVVPAVGTEEALVAAGEFLLAICPERLRPLVERAPAAFVLQAGVMQPVIRDEFGEPNGARPKLIQVRAEMWRRATPS